MRILIQKTVISLTLYSVSLFLPTSLAYGQPDNSETCRPIKKKSQTNDSPCIRCTQAYFTPNFDLLVSSGNSTLYYRKKKEKSFSVSPVSLSGPHSIVYLADDNVFYVSDTENNRILALSSLERGTILREIKSIDGIKLKRVHDIVYDRENDWLYAINPEKPTIFRFSHHNHNESSLDLSHVLEYSRSLSFIDGKVFVSGSSVGKILKIQDFDTGLFEEYQSPGKKGDAYAGSWEKDGLIINDIEYYQGYWYVSSYFCPSCARSSDNYNKNKLVRFKAWKDFVTGNWQDLSSFLPDGLVPYFLTAHPNGLAVALFNHEIPGNKDTIYSMPKYCTPSQTSSLLLSSESLAQETDRTN